MARFGEREMVKNIRVVLAAICLFVFFIVALVILLQMAPWAVVSEFGRQLVQSIPPAAQATVLIVSVILMLIVGCLAVRELREQVHITKESDEGSVTVVESAITRFIRQVALDIESVEKVRTELSSTPDGLVVDLFTKVLVTETLPEIEGTIRSRVRKALEETLGVGGVAAINVVVEDFRKAESLPGGTSLKVTPTPAAKPAEKDEGSGGTGSGGFGRFFARSKSRDDESRSEPENPEQTSAERDD